VSQESFLYDNPNTLCREIRVDGGRRMIHCVSSNMLAEIAELEVHSDSRSSLRKLRAREIPWESGQVVGEEES
jgi:hypothetical protein